eukprot:4814535-Pyramimonas_sp.AAC.2
MVRGHDFWDVSHEGSDELLCIGETVANARVAQASATAHFENDPPSIREALGKLLRRVRAALRREPQFVYDGAGLAGGNTNIALPLTSLCAALEAQGSPGGIPTHSAGAVPQGVGKCG